MANIEEVSVNNTTSNTSCSNAKGFPDSTVPNPAAAQDKAAEARQPKAGESFAPLADRKDINN